MSAASRKRLAAAPADGERGHGPYGKRPHGPVLLPGERQPMLAAVLDGVQLGAFDRRAVEWLCRWADTPTFLALLGVVHRPRQAAVDRAAADRGGVG